MNKVILCALIALLPASLIAAEQVSVQARLIETPANARIPRDIARLTKGSKLDVITTPRIAATLGRETTVFEHKLDFRVPLPNGGSRLVPCGVTLNVTPHRNEGKLSYTATLTCRDVTRAQDGHAGDASKKLFEFTSHELVLSGTPKANEPIWCEVPSQGGRKLAICIQFNADEV